MSALWAIGLALALAPKLCSAAEPARPRVFLSCAQDCFESFLRQELTYFDWVRDPHLSNVITLVVARQPAGNGGERFSVTGVNNAEHVTGSSAADKHDAAEKQTAALPEPNVTRSFIAAPGTPNQQSRQLLLQLVLRTLHSKLQGTTHEDAFVLSLPSRDGTQLSDLTDPWNYWVISPELVGEAQGGSGFYFGELTGSLNVRRITAPHKLRLRAAYSRLFSGYRLQDGTRVSGDTYGWDGRAIYAASLGEHWALGATVAGHGSEFENIAGHVRGGPLVEFNFFPYAENASQQLRLAYQAGTWANWYFEPNVANRMREVRAYHALSLVADANQVWGSVQWVGQVNSFILDPKLYRLSTGALLALRLFAGFALNLEGNVALVRDLLSERARPITDEELLIGTAQQPTNYLFEVKFGLSYTFGSVHNTIVNPRFGGVDLEKE